MPILNYDLVNALINLTPESTLAEARKKRLNTTENTQAAFEAIFSAPSTQLTGDVKFLLARFVAEQTGSPALADFYHQLLAQRSPALDTPALKAATKYVEILVSHPKQTHYQLIHSLIESGWNEQDIILLAQLVTFVTYQARLIEGLKLLHDASATSNQAEPITAGPWNNHPLTHQGRPSPVAFTQEQLGWEAWLQARDKHSLTADEAQVMKKFGQLNSEYFLLLAHHSNILEIRTMIDRDIFYTANGLPRWEREFAAAVVSKVNGCIYCASVHARKASQYAKDRQTDVARLLATPAGDVLANGYDARLTAITDLAASLSATPIQATPQHINTLRQLGLTELELLDLIQSTAFFSWANRLMLSLGEPFEVTQDKE
ncbi:alkylhydroperoxidase domain protein [Providencia stuartii]|uniref:alkylhydroperoxidase domain protein n=1 Tax=Providencia stuartii TaxID=588 RepID=UPI0018C605BF|nr:alkylhydroperoxidase domain protein [Providencia stuartii]MBG5918821.1 alkylhydroperoxidase domain protein [Providencia stuartii]